MIVILVLFGLCAYAQKPSKTYKEEEIDYNSQWFKERMEFNRSSWDAEEKKIFEEKLQEKQKEFGEGMHQDLAIAFAEEWATCSMREKFRTEKGSLAIEKSEKYGKEMKRYWDEIYDRCDKARWKYYRLSKEFKKQIKNQDKKQ